mgnify:CR=1 FL=1
MKFSGPFLWKVRWILDRRWRESTRARVLREKTALRRFVMGRLG